MNVRVKASGQVGSLVAEVNKRCFIRFGDSSSQIIIEYGRKEIQKYGGKQKKHAQRKNN